MAGSVLMGGGIAGMHYIGMAAMRLPAMCHYSSALLAISVVLAVVISSVALLLAFRSRGELTLRSVQKILSAMIMGAAIPAMHYTGMAAATFTYAEPSQMDLSHAISISSLVTAGIIVVTFMVLVLALVTSQVGRRFSEQTKELALSEKRSRQILETALDAFVGTDSTGKITDWNEQAERTLGWSFAEAVGKDFSETVIPARFGEPYGENLRQLLLGSNGDQFPNRRFEARVLCRNGREIPVEITMSIVESEGTSRFAAFIRDMRDKERAEEKFRGVLDSVSETILFVNARGRIAVVNAQAEKLFGYSRAELLDQPIEMLMPENLKNKHLDHLSAFFKNPNARPMGIGLELSARKKDGSEFFVEIGLTPLETEDGLLISTLILDITARKEKEKVLQQTHEKLSMLLVEAEQRAQDAARLTELLDVLQSCQTVQEGYRAAESYLPKAVSSRSGALCITNSSRNLIEAVATWGEKLDTATTFRPDDCWGLRRGKVHRVVEGDPALRCVHVTKLPADGHLCVPLVAQGETLGVLYLEYMAPRHETSPEASPDRVEPSVRQAVAVSEGLSLALANLKLREALRSQSIRDPLTGLFNRRYMEETLERELKRAARNGEPLSLLMFDIDHFKTFNDAFGHQAGDAVLRSFGESLIRNTRGQDVACRYGGEEFALILTGSPMQGACKRAEALCEETRRLSVEHAGQALAKVSVSIGVAAFPSRASSTELVCAADQALYRAKASGRDRVVADDGDSLREVAAAQVSMLAVANRPMQ